MAQQQGLIDSFDRGWSQQAQQPLSVGNREDGKVIEHTFFDNNDQGIQMLVNEQKQIEKMQTYNFQ